MEFDVAEIKNQAVAEITRLKNLNDEMRNELILINSNIVSNNKQIRLIKKALGITTHRPRRVNLAGVAIEDQND